MAGSETEAILGALDRQRWTFRWKADGLDAAGLAVHVGASTLTLGGLLKHLAIVEDFISTTKLDGASIGEPWIGLGAEDDGDWEFRTAATDTPETLYGLYDGAVVRSRARWADAIAAGGLDGAVAAGWEGRHANARRLLLDLLEEYGRHTGHADLLREAVDGRVGEDPPEGWRPASGAWGG